MYTFLPKIKIFISEFTLNYRPVERFSYKNNLLTKTLLCDKIHRGDICEILCIINTLSLTYKIPYSCEGTKSSNSEKPIDTEHLKFPTRG